MRHHYNAEFFDPTATPILDSLVKLRVLPDQSTIQDPSYTDPLEFPGTCPLLHVASKGCTVLHMLGGSVQLHAGLAFGVDNYKRTRAHNHIFPNRTGSA